MNNFGICVNTISHFSVRPVFRVKRIKNAQKANKTIVSSHLDDVTYVFKCLKMVIYDCKEGKFTHGVWIYFSTKYNLTRIVWR